MNNLLNNKNEINYKSILYTNLPDKHLEYFWYNFKEFIKNHIKIFSNIKKQIIEDNINSFSNELNILQNEKKFIDIEIFIYQYLLYCQYEFLNLFKLVDNSLINISILQSFFNLLLKFYKRWNNICNSSNIIPITLDNSVYLCNINLPNSKYLLNTIILLQVNIHITNDMYDKYLNILDKYFHLDFNNYWYKKNYQIKTENIDNMIYMLHNFWKKCIPYFLIYNINKQWYAGLNFINLEIKIIPFWISQIKINNPDKLNSIIEQICNHNREISIKKLLSKYNKLIEYNDFYKFEKDY